MLTEKLKLPLKTVFISLTFLFVQSADCQIFIEKGPVGALKGAEIMIYGPDLSQMMIPYSRVKGSPFWNRSVAISKFI